MKLIKFIGIFLLIITNNSIAQDAKIVPNEIDNFKASLVDHIGILDQALVYKTKVSSNYDKETKQLISKYVFEYKGEVKMSQILNYINLKNFTEYVYTFYCEGNIIVEYSEDETNISRKTPVDIIENNIDLKLLYINVVNHNITD